MSSSIGKREISFEDKTRENWIEKDKHRPINMVFWYPSTETKTTAIGIGPEEEPLFTVGDYALDGEVDRSYSHCRLAVISHGTGGAAYHYAWLANTLVQSGYIVVGINHHGNNLYEEYTPEGFGFWWHRSEDIHQAIHYTITESFVSALIDKNNIVLIGHSLGSYSIINALGGISHPKAYYEKYKQYIDDPDSGAIPPEIEDKASFVNLINRLIDSDHLSDVDPAYKETFIPSFSIKAVCLMAPALGETFGIDGLRPVKTPTLIVIPKVDTITPNEFNGYIYEKGLENSELLVLDNKSDHYTFLATATVAGKALHPIFCQDHPSIDRDEIHSTVASAVLDFFDKHIS
ncbi:alpha/beta hydrolase family protein [Spirochaeta cellobiosiphila]|uniref:alpha/beta hydrolase family protein n=1 Tax=Spirochaeta cellobiosiphila TaxID=504483 RepID=UPI0003FF9A17|nr:hypothetical protein [Spirochaeta cellobiosiphila]